MQPTRSLHAQLFALSIAALLFGGCLQTSPDVTSPTNIANADNPDALSQNTSPTDPANPQNPPSTTPKLPPGDPCPLRASVELAPGATPEQRTLDYWTKRLGEEHDLDAPLLSPTQIHDHNTAAGTIELGLSAALSAQDREALLASVNERLDYLHKQLSDRAHVNADASPISPTELAFFNRVDTIPFTPRLHLSLGIIPLRCGPRVEGFYKPDIDLSFDRNACSAIRDQELVEVLSEWPNGMKLARTRYVLGWIAGDAPLSPPLPEHFRPLAASSARLHALNPLSLRSDDGTATLDIAAGVRLLPSPDAPGRVLFATSTGFYTSQPLTASDIEPDARPITRRAVLEKAFSYLGQPYGWGGVGGGRDCSRFLLDIFASFNLHIPRHSADQAASGTFSIDLSRVPGERDRLLLIDEAARRGVVLLFFPGHIMLYLGRSHDGKPMAIHSLAEFVTSCDPTLSTQNPTKETLNSVLEVSVTDLEIGRGTSRTSFLERITKVTVIGLPPGEGLDGVAERRTPAPQATAAITDCKSQTGVSVFFSPERPHVGQPLRVIALSKNDPGSSRITLISPDGSAVVPESQRLGGPPYSHILTINNPMPGTWTAVLGEGNSVLGCERVEVSTTPKPRKGRADVVWEVERAWNPALEDFYAAFVEALFNHSMEGDPTWKNLHTLLRDEDRNILFNHLGHNEDNSFELEPDCADLPYSLRAYFAWKLALPYGFRKCNRGQSNSPPTCESIPQTNVSMSKGPDPVRAFDRFVNGDVRNVVHSGCGRVGADDDATDYYPVPLTREALRPGTLYADPYGHLLVVARWEPQGFDRYGVLVAADAQPDGTVGLKRFWRGTFLFSSSTKNAGAGFKAYRPLVMRGGDAVALGNDEINKSGKYVPHSMEQYKGTNDDFYDSMDALINPRPLDPFAMQLWLIDALDEAIQFRILAVNNGEDYMKKSGGKFMDMPSGKAIFNTLGPWEDFATPSRDMRVLIAIDTIEGFPDRVARAPQRFGIEAADAAETVQKLKAFLAAELTKRTFSYVRSDGSTQVVTFAELAARKAGLEMSYNPNDCIEHRWGALEGSVERSTCKRIAPDNQRQKMATYRTWFATRTRPN